MADHVKAVFEGILKGDIAASKEAISRAIYNDIPPEEVLTNGLISAMDEVGRRFELGDFFVPEMLVSARAMKQGLETLKPRLIDADIKPAGRIAIGTVKDDIHDIGKNLVGIMMEGAGFEIKDLGVDVSREKFIDYAKSGKVDIIAMSALLTTTMVEMKYVIDGIKEAGISESVKIIVGGAPVTDEYASKIGADGYAQDAGSAARLARELISMPGPLQPSS